PPFRSLPVEERDIDAAVDLVQVHGVDSALEPGVLGLESSDGVIVEPLFVRVALPEGEGHPLQDLVIEGQSTDEVNESGFEDLLPRVGLRALSPIAGAVVVGVATLLDLPHQRAAAVTARDE